MASKKKLKMSIELTQKETEMCDLLRDVVKTKNLGTTMRVAGGWVRDKLLGLDSDDIDIALDNMMGKEFAEHVNDHLKQKGLKTKTIGVIKLNPDQSKHLETATVSLFDTWVDFVNLRSETYEADSRIPDKIGFGTPTEDAFRRDITINALFYNINEGLIEDFTGQGIADLQDGIVRTPLDPIVTFTDDPLRCLRVIRFAGRFNFVIDPVTYAALSSDVSRGGIKNKVSRERIGKEIEKMLKDSNGSIALFHLHQTRLFDVVFQPHDPSHLIADASLQASKISRCAHWVLAEKSLGFQLDQEEKKLLYLSAALVSYRNSTFQDKRNKTVSQPGTIVLESIKLPTKESKTTSSILESLDEFRALAQDPSSISRKTLGLALRRPAEHWRSVLVLALALEISPFLKTLDPKETVEFGQDISGTISRYRAFADLVSALHLLDSWNEKPLVNGKDLSALLNIPAGPMIGPILQELQDWQLENPGATADDAKTWLLSQKNSGKWSS